MFEKFFIFTLASSAIYVISNSALEFVSYLVIRKKKRFLLPFNINQWHSLLMFKSLNNADLSIYHYLHIEWLIKLNNDKERPYYSIAFLPRWIVRC